MGSRYAAAVVIGLVALLCGASRAAAERANGRNARAEAAERLYEKGVDCYAEGRSKEALSVFMESLRLQPDNEAARAAVRRIRAELLTSHLAQPAAPAPHRSRTPPLSDTVDRVLLEKIPGYLRFDRHLGDALSRAGTVHAFNGTVAQLLAERRFAASRRKTFCKERELRALLRRLPAYSEGASAPA